MAKPTQTLKQAATKDRAGALQQRQAPTPAQKRAAEIRQADFASNKPRDDGAQPTGQPNTGGVRVVRAPAGGR